jgi:hypothetical protein
MIGITTQWMPPAFCLVTFETLALFVLSQPRRKRPCHLRFMLCRRAVRDRRTDEPAAC